MSFQVPFSSEFLVAYITDDLLLHIIIVFLAFIRGKKLEITQIRVTRVTPFKSNIESNLEKF